MTENTPGDRFPLLLYRTAVARYRVPPFLLALLLLGLWVPVSQGRLAWPQASAGPWLFAGGSVAGLFWLFTLVAPGWAYVQPRTDHLRLRTPIYRLNIPYRRVLNTRSVLVAKAFPPREIRRAHRKLVEPFLGHIALGLDLRSFPVAPTVLRLFLHPLFMAPDRTGLILIVDDWMKLSEQISDRMQTDRSDRQTSEQHFSDAARILAEEGRE